MKRLEHFLLIVLPYFLVMALLTAISWFREGHIPMGLLGFALVVMSVCLIVELYFIEDGYDA